MCDDGGGKVPSLIVPEPVATVAIEPVTTPIEVEKLAIGTGPDFVATEDGESEKDWDLSLKGWIEGSVSVQFY